MPLFRLLDIPQRHQVGDVLGWPGQDEFWLSFTVVDGHCNLLGNCSGGVIASIFDIGMGLACCTRFDRLLPMPTISLTLDYIAPVPVGATPLLKAKLVRATRTLGFVEAQFFHGGAVSVRGSGIFRLPKPNAQAAGPLDMIFRKELSKND